MLPNHHTRLKWRAKRDLRPRIYPFAADRLSILAIGPKSAASPPRGPGACSPAIKHPDGGSGGHRFTFLASRRGRGCFNMAESSVLGTQPLARPNRFPDGARALARSFSVECAEITAAILRIKVAVSRGSAPQPPKRPSCFRNSACASAG